MTQNLTRLHDDKNINKKEGFDFLVQFTNDSEKEGFIRKCYEKEKTRLMWNRLKWFVELAYQQKYDAVKVFFLTAMAETNIKLSENRFDKSNNQTEDVKKFFKYFSVDDRRYFEDNFLYPIVYGEPEHKIHFDNIIEILLSVRHRVVHGKDHYSFNFPDHDNVQPTLGELNQQPFQYDLKLTYKDYRSTMIKYAVMNISNNL